MAPTYENKTLQIPNVEFFAGVAFFVCIAYVMIFMLDTAWAASRPLYKLTACFGSSDILVFWNAVSAVHLIVF